MPTIAPDVAPLLNRSSKGLSTTGQGNKSKYPIALLLLAIVVVLIGAGTVRQMMAPPPKQTVSVVGAASDIPPGCKLAFANLHYVEIPKKYLTPDMMTSSEQAVGFVTRIFLPTGEPITKDHLFPGKKNMSLACETHERAITLKLDDDALVDHNLFPGDTVDAVATLSKNGQKYTRTICQDIRVLMCTTKNGMLSNTARTNANHVTLAVLPAQAEFLSEASETGKIRLLLRNRLSTNTHKLPGISEDDLLPASAHVHALERTPIAQVLNAPEIPPPPVPLLHSFGPSPQELSSQIQTEIQKPIQWVVEMFSGAKRETVEVGVR